MPVWDYPSGIETSIERQEYRCYRRQGLTPDQALARIKGVLNTMPYPDSDYNDPDFNDPLYNEPIEDNDLGQWIKVSALYEMIDQVKSDRLTPKCVDCGASNPIGETLIPIVETTLLMGDIEAHMCTGCIRQLEHTGNTPYTLTPIQYRVNRNPYYRGSK
jgi:hypothetical protein